jgi:hypothetical protein
LERPFAHLYETGGMHRVHLRGHTNIRKRLLIHATGYNLGLLMRQLIGVGTPRGLHGRLVATVAALLVLIRFPWERHQASRAPFPTHPPRALASRSCNTRRVQIATSCAFTLLHTATLHDRSPRRGDHASVGEITNLACPG